MIEWYANRVFRIMILYFIENESKDLTTFLFQSLRWRLCVWAHQTNYSMWEYETWAPVSQLTLFISIDNAIWQRNVKQMISKRKSLANRYFLPYFEYIYICMCKLIIKVKSIRYVCRIVVRWHFIREYATRSSSCWFFFISDASYINIYAIATRRYKRDSWNFERYNNKTKIANQLYIEFIRQIQQFEGQFYHFHRNFSVDV